MIYLNDKYFKNAIISENTRYEIKEGVIWWYEGTWISGTWPDGCWCGGDWQTGTWYLGNFTSGLWRDGIWLDGSWSYHGTWLNGNWKRGWIRCLIKKDFSNFFKESEYKQFSPKAYFKPKLTMALNYATYKNN